MVKSKVKFLGKAQVSLTTKGWGSVRRGFAVGRSWFKPLYMAPHALLKKKTIQTKTVCLYSFTRHVDKALTTVIIILI